MGSGLRLIFAHIPWLQDVDNFLRKYSKPPPPFPGWIHYWELLLYKFVKTCSFISLFSECSKYQSESMKCLPGRVSEPYRFLNVAIFTKVFKPNMCDKTSHKTFSVYFLNQRICYFFKLEFTFFTQNVETISKTAIT